MGKLAHNIWFAGILTLRPRPKLLHRGVHRAADVCVRAAITLLELHKARPIALVNPLVHLAIDLAIATLVTHRPEYHRGVVLVALNHSPHTVVVCALPLLTMRGVERWIGVAIPRTTTVCLDISLVDKQDTVLIAEVVPLHRLRIVARTNGIDVVLLHQRYILEHQLARDNMTRCGIMLVDVHAVDHQRLTIQQKLRIANLDLTESRAARCRLHHPTVGTLERHHSSIEVRRLVAP